MWEGSATSSVQTRERKDEDSAVGKAGREWAWASTRPVTDTGEGKTQAEASPPTPLSPRHTHIHTTVESDVFY